MVLMSYILKTLLFYQGRKVKCSPAQAKHRLFIGNVPRNWGEEEMKKAVNKVGPGVIKIELLKVCMLSYLVVSLFYCIKAFKLFLLFEGKPVSIKLLKFFSHAGSTEFEPKPWICIH